MGSKLRVLGGQQDKPRGSLFIVWAASGIGEKRGTSYIADVKHIFFLFNISKIYIRLVKRAQLSC
jgi:hypothetical protein